MSTSKSTSKIACVQVLVDGCDVKEMDLQCLRSKVGLVSQEPVLFSCSVRDNICYGNPDASQQQIEDAARAANAHSFIQKLPEGYSTQVHPPVSHVTSMSHFFPAVRFACMLTLHTC